MGVVCVEFLLDGQQRVSAEKQGLQLHSLQMGPNLQPKSGMGLGFRLGVGSYSFIT